MAILEHNWFVWDDLTPRETTANAVAQEKVYDMSQVLGLDATYGCADMEVKELRVSGPRHLLMELVRYADKEAGAWFSRVSVDTDDDFEFFERHPDFDGDVVYGG